MSGVLFWIYFVPVTVVAFGTVGLVLASKFGRSRRWRRAASARGLLCSDPPEGWIEALTERVVISGHLAGLRVRLSSESRRAGKHAYEVMVAELTTPPALSRSVFAQGEGGFLLLARTLGRIARKQGPAGLDAVLRFNPLTDEDCAVLEAPPVSATLLRLVRGATRTELEDGTLKLEYFGPLLGWKLARVLDDLRELAAELRAAQEGRSPESGHRSSAS